MSGIQRIALVLTIIGAINWGLIGFFQFDLVAAKKGRFLIQSMGEDNGHSGIRRCSVLGENKPQMVISNI